MRIPTLPRLEATLSGKSFRRRSCSSCCSCSQELRFLKRPCSRHVSLVWCHLYVMTVERDDIVHECKFAVSLVQIIFESPLLFLSQILQEEEGDNIINHTKGCGGTDHMTLPFFSFLFVSYWRSKTATKHSARTPAPSRK